MRAAFPLDTRDEFRILRKAKQGAQDQPQHRIHASAQLAQSALWHRQPALPVFTKGDIDHRRAKQVVPGSRLVPTSMDDIIPVVIIATRSTSQASKECLSGFTLLVPRRWGNAFWLSLVHPGTRVAGQAQIRQQGIEGGKLAFPFDFVGTAMFDAYWKQEGQVQKRIWEKRPRGKRVEYEKLEIRFPYGGKAMWTQCIRNGWLHAGETMHPLIKSVLLNQKTQPWLLHIRKDTARLHTIARILLQQPEAPLEEISRALTELLPLPGSAWTANDISRLASALVSVKLVACSRGNFTNLSPIYLDGLERDAQWRDTLHAAASEGQLDHADSIRELESGSIAAGRQIGATTSGGYSLSKGKGYAVGSVSFLAYLATLLRNEDESHREALAQRKRKGRNPVDTSSLLIIRDLGGPTLRAASASLAR